MGGSSKSGGANSNQNLNYYGTIAGAIGWGPLDWLTAVICNGNYLWQCSADGPLDLTAYGVVNDQGYIDLTSALLDPTLIAPGGYFRLYRGVPTQVADGGIAGQPPYLDTIYIVAVNIFFGENSGSPPNFQIIGGRLPRIDTSIVAAEDNVANNRQINPIAALAEILTDERGIGLSLAQLDSSSWIAAGHWVAQDPDHINFCFCSPLINGQTAYRDIVKALLDPFNGYLQWTADGTLGCFIYEWGTNPGGLTTIDARHWVKPPEIQDGDWQDVPTELVVTFTDSAYEFQTNSVSIPNARAQIIRQLDDQRTLDRSNITNLAQAQSQGVEYTRRIGMAPGTGSGDVRGPIVAGILPGSKYLINDEPDPASEGEAQLVRIDKVQRDTTDKVTISFTIDPLLPAIAYTPAWISPLPGAPVTAPISPPLVYALGIPLPPLGWGYPPTVGFVTTRPSAQVLGFNILFGTDPEGAFADLGIQVGFAVRCGLVSSIADTDATMTLQLLDGADGPDAYLAANTPGGNLTQAQGNVLLVVLAQLDDLGRVAIDENNDPLLEFASIIQRSAVTSDTFDYSVIRGVLGTAATAWDPGVAAWIVPFRNLIPWSHPLFVSLLGNTAYFRLIDYTSGATDESNPPPEADVVFPSSYTQPPGTGTPAPDNGINPNPVTDVDVTTGVEMLVLTWTDESNTPLRATLIWEGDTDVFPGGDPTFTVMAPQAFLFRNGLPEGTTKYYWLQEQATTLRVSTIAGPFSNTVVTWPVVTGIEATIATETSDREDADSELSTAITDASDSLSASITAESTAREAADGSLAAEYILNVTTDDGGVERVAGFRITNLGGAGGASEFVVQADLFAVVNSDGDSGSQQAPFAVEDGVVYLNTAIIGDASISSAMIDSIVADQIEAGSIDIALTITSGGSLTVEGSFYTDGSTIDLGSFSIYDDGLGWKIDFGFGSAVRENYGINLETNGDGAHHAFVLGGSMVIGGNTAGNVINNGCLYMFREDGTYTGAYLYVNESDGQFHRVDAAGDNVL